MNPTVTIVEDVSTVSVLEDNTTVQVNEETVELLTIGIQGPAGAGIGHTITVASTAPSSPSINDLWVDTT